MDEKRDHWTECFICIHMREVQYNSHISCNKPSIDVLRNGNQHGKKNGWFMYPLLFDPVWKESLCPNFSRKNDAVNPAISLAVSPEPSAPITS